MSNVIKIKRGSGSDPSASDMVLGEPVLRTDTAELFFKKDDGSVAKVSGGGGGPDFKYLELRNAANNGAASYPANDFTLVSAGTTTAVSPTAAATLLVSVSGVIQKPNSGTSTSGITGFIVDGSRFKTATNLTAAPDFIIYQESGGIGEPSDNTVTSAKIVDGAIVNADINASAAIAGSKLADNSISLAKLVHGDSNNNGKFLRANNGADPTFETVNTDLVSDTSPQLGGNLDVNTKNILFGDSASASDDRLIFGAGSDLSIYHDPNDSFIKNITGNLEILTDEFRLRTSSAGKTFMMASINAEVQLMYNNSKKFETKNDGVDITGELQCDSLDVDGNADFTGNITVSGTVDGRDLATDGSKLDGIAAGATNVSNTNQLTNGAGIISSPDGRNAATLDSLDSSQFVRSDASDTLTGGTYTFSSTTDQKIILAGSSNPYIRFREGTTDRAYIQFNSNNFFYFANQQYGTNLKLGNTFTFHDGSADRTVYHTGNLPTIPTNNNQLTNGAGYITSAPSPANAAFAWSNFDSTNSSIRGSYNVSSMTDLGTGNFRLNFSNNASNNNYALQLTGTQTTSNTAISFMASSSGPNLNSNSYSDGNFTTSSCRFIFGYGPSSVPMDSKLVCCTVHES